MSSITHKQLVESYEVIRVLGQGSFGKVFLVRHKETKIQLAMKKYSKYHILKNGKQKSLIRSSRILQALEHNQIIKFLYYAISEDDDQIFLIFEACKKGSLEQVKEKIYDMKQMTLIKEIMYQLAEGLQYLKSVAVAHRDMKPSNISFTSEGMLKIIDFDEAICFKQSQQSPLREQGLARQLMQQTSNMKMYSRRSRANSFVGTELYMSPQMRQQTITDERGDVWAYGCILYELVAGRSLMAEHEEDDEPEITVNRVHEELTKFDIEPADVEGVIDLLNKILQVDPNKRLPVQKIMEHSFFQELRTNNRNYYRNKLKKFLRGNFNLSDPRNILDALNMDLIGMKSAPQKFSHLTHYPILLQITKKPITESPPSRLTIVKQYLTNFLKMPSFRVCYLFGGSRYFKQRSTINQDQKSYIFYDQIDRMKIVQDSIVIQGSNLEKWNKKQRKEECSWEYLIKTVTGDRFQLGALYDMLMYIFND